MKNEEISKLNKQLENLKTKYRFFQKCQENEKERHNFYNPEEYCDSEIDRWEYEMKCQYRMADNKVVLKSLQNNIKEVRKKIKKIQRNGK